MECIFCSANLSSPSRLASIQNHQGSNSWYKSGSYSRTVNYKVFSPQRVGSAFHSGGLPFISKRSYKRTIVAESSRQGWDFGRFFKTLYFFNGPPNPVKFIESLIEKLSSPAASEVLKDMPTSDVVLVAGATGGVGRRVVDVLRKNGSPVRVLVRNKEKALKMFGPDIDMIVGDITKENTLDPEYFKGIKKVINAVSVIVGPKEGDTPDRAKYAQGIKFFEPEIKGDSPEKVQYIGMKNLINAVKNSTGQLHGKLLFGFSDVSICR